MNPLVKNFVNNYLSNTDKITLQSLNDNAVCVKSYLNSDITSEEEELLKDMLNNLCMAKMYLGYIQNENGDEDTKNMYQLKFNEHINNTYRIAERLLTI